MKVEELMIGDWVKYLGRQWRVIDIATTSHYPITLGEDYFEKCDDNGTRFLNKQEIEQVDPIQITSELLYQNGIELVDVGDNGPSTPPKHRNRYEKYFIHTKWKDTHLWFDRTTKKYHLSNMGEAKIEYVHELQHALRLCRVDLDLNVAKLQ